MTKGTHASWFLVSTAHSWVTMVASMSSFSSAAAVTKRLEPSEDSASSGSLQSRLFQSPGERTILLCLLLTVVVIVSYSPVTRNGFLNHDDYGYITQNPHVRAGLTWATVKWAFTTLRSWRTGIR